MSHQHKGVLEDYGGPETYGERVWMYDWALSALTMLGLRTGDVIVDAGAGFCDFDMRLRQCQWFGKYVPVDGAIDGVDLETWEPFEADFFVCIDTVEHLHDWQGLVERMKSKARKGVIVITPNGDTVDVLAMHETHFSSVNPEALREHDLNVMEQVLGDYKQMLGFWSKEWVA